LVELKNLHLEVVNFRQTSIDVSANPILNKGAIGGTNYIRNLFRINEISVELSELGVQI
jgi:hypothetical protein